MHQPAKTSEQTDIHETRHTVRSYDCGPGGRLRIPVLLQYIQDAAAVHADRLGFGTNALAPTGCFWILGNLRLSLHRLPQYTHAFTLRTWPSGAGRVVATREFELLDPDSGALLAAAGSHWMVLRRDITLPRMLRKIGLHRLAAGPAAYSADMPRLRPPAVDGPPADHLRVPHSAIDLNGHVNNTEYVRWALDVLHHDHPDHAPIRTLHITFLAETFENDPLDFWIAPDRAGHTILARRHDDPADIFTAHVTYQPH